jgi:hypothetical protein
MRVAVAATVGRVVNVNAPVLAVRTDLRGAHALAVLDVPVLANLANLGDAGAFAFRCIVDHAWIAWLHRRSAFAGAVFCVKVVVASALRWALRNLTRAFAGDLVPVEPSPTGDGQALTFAFVGVPEEVVRALLRTANARADGLIENFAFRALDGAALALAGFGVDVLLSVADRRHFKIVTLALTQVSAPVKLFRAVVGGFRL